MRKDFSDIIELPRYRRKIIQKYNAIISLRHSIRDFLNRLYDSKEFFKRIESFGARYCMSLGKEFDDYVFGEKNSRRLFIIIIIQFICLLNCLRFIIAVFVDNRTVQVMLMDVTLEISHRMGASLILIIFFVCYIIMRTTILSYAEENETLLRRNILTEFINYMF